MPFLCAPVAAANTGVGVGPIIGATAAAGIYKLLKVVNYQCANPGQDADGLYTDSDGAARGHIFTEASPSTQA